MSKVRPKAALVILLGLTGWAGVVLRGAERPTAADKVERAEVDRLEAESTSIDPEADNPTRQEVPPRVTAGSADPDCNVVGAYLVSFAATNGYRGNVFRVTADADVKEIKMELAFAGTANFSAAIHQRQTDGRYTQIGSTIELFGRTGAGVSTPVLVTTEEIDPPIHLTAGFDYAIGFAWGQAYNVTFGRNSVSHPVDFEVGQVLGSVVRNNLGTPLVPFEFAALSVFSGGSYSMEVCLVPEPGACCDTASQSCVSVLEPDCTGLGSYFHGERTSCAETVCRFGACCDPCGTCENDYVPESCTLIGGDTHWSGVSCSTPETLLCPRITGACCRPNGVCEITCQRECEQPPPPDLPGVYHGDGTTCSPDPCKGACCISGFGCADTTRADCLAFEGTPRDAGTTCETLPAGQECPGACCFGNASTGLTGCTDVNARSTCRNLFPQMGYKGEGTTCPADGIAAFCQPYSDYHACCLIGVNACVNVLRIDQCPPHVGDHFGTEQCATHAGGCQPHRRACCLPNGTCSVLTNSQCSQQSGIWNSSDISCLSDSCVFGACCGSTPAACSLAPRWACEADGRIYRGDGTTCASPLAMCPGFGSCCREDGGCFDDETVSQCGIQSGSYQGHASECGPSPDCDARGACCASTGTCLLATADECAQIVGEFGGSGTTCGANSCPRGACCVGESCAIRTIVGCEIAQGEFQGEGSACTPNLCTLAACCHGDTCTLETETNCNGSQGSFAGIGLDCDAGRCLTGVCCSVADECSTLREFECTADGGEFLSTGSVCGAGNNDLPCQIGACCRRGSCVPNMRRGSCEDPAFGGTFLGEATLCGDDTCVPGACCDPAHVANCDDVIRSVCELAGHTFRGPGTTCETPGVCPCNNAGQCDDGLFCNGNELCNTNITPHLCEPGTPPCDDGRECTVDTCFEENNDCANIRDDQACNDGFFCNGVETCDDNDACVPGTPPDCGVAGACTGLAALSGMVECLEGPGTTAVSNCECHDLDADGDVDLEDVAVFQLGSVAP